MRLLFLTPYYPPEVGAPQVRISELATRLVRRGHLVQVLTALPNYPSGVVPPEYRDRAGTWETRDGVEIFRTWIYATPNKGFLRRILAHLSFMVMAIMTAPRLAPYDVVYVESPPLFDGVAGWALARFRDARLVFNVADLWPQSVVDLGMIRPGLALSLATWLEKWCYRNSDLILAVTTGIERLLRERGYGDKVAWFPNGVDTARFETGKPEPYRRDLGLEGKVAFLYAGTFGLAQGLESVLEAARLVADDPRIRFVLAGDGAERDHLVQSAPPNVIILPSQPAGRMPDLLAAADVSLVTLRDLPLFLGAVPSKTYEAFAAARPILMAAKGEAPAMLERARAGVVVPPEDPAALAAAARDLAADPERCRTLGENGRRFVREHFDRDELTARFEALISRLIGPEASADGMIGT